MRFSISYYQLISGGEKEQMCVLALSVLPGQTLKMQNIIAIAILLLPYTSFLMDCRMRHHRAFISPGSWLECFVCLRPLLSLTAHLQLRGPLPVTLHARCSHRPAAARTAPCPVTAHGEQSARRERSEEGVLRASAFGEGTLQPPPRRAPASSNSPSTRAW